jgi:polyribonucleotide nucleotidyltransferase
VVATLGTSIDEQKIDALEGQTWKSYMLHYNFPPFSVGETRPMRGPGRREIGHGALAERAVAPVLPQDEDFPYTIRLVAEILESNGSSSMASVCGASLALMDAGVPIQSPVAGIAMGLISDGERTAVLTDIQGVEDHLGDMDFKVTGTRTGITALQMDNKIGGLAREVLVQALEQARDARIHILDKMDAAIPTARPDLSPHAPRITLVKIPTEKIGELIGPGGRMIKKITEETGCQIDISDDGSVKVASRDAEASKRALAVIHAVTADPEIGRDYRGVVKRVVNFGAFVEILPGRDGLVHISELAPERVNQVEDILNVGDEVVVKVIGIDPEGKIRLSRKAVLATQES